MTKLAVKAFHTAHVRELYVGRDSLLISTRRASYSPYTPAVTVEPPAPKHGVASVAMATWRLLEIAGIDRSVNAHVERRVCPRTRGYSWHNGLKFKPSPSPGLIS